MNMPFHSELMQKGLFLRNLLDLACEGANHRIQEYGSDSKFGKEYTQIYDVVRKIRDLSYESNTTMYFSLLNGKLITEFNKDFKMDP